MQSHLTLNAGVTCSGEVAVAEGVDRSLLDSIALHADLTPDKPAVVHADTRMSYLALEQESDHLAACLHDTGVGRDSCIALFLDRSPEFIVAALAVLKTGAAYLPMDPTTPVDRAAFILADSGANMVLSRNGLTSDWRESRCRVLELEVLVGATASSHWPGPEPVESNSLAYVIYTSGSTGQPKGVEISHANLANLIEWHVRNFDIKPTDRVSQVAGLGFDATVWEVWPNLVAGATVHMVDDRIRRTPTAFRNWLVSERITVSFAPTVLAEQLLHLAWPTATSLRLLLTGADTLNGRPSENLPFSLVNNYGPTECTVVATSGQVTARPGDHSRPSIGRPIYNTTALILDEACHPVSPGEAGELCLAGALVGRGYRNNPELTRRRFTEVQLPGGGHARAYRTGDRVRLLENGEIEFLGRFDNQVKIRGYRVELGEIEAWLGRVPGVSACVVTMRDASQDRDLFAPTGSVIGVGGIDAGATGMSELVEPYLVAYLVGAEGSTLETTVLRDSLTSRLPDYMIPDKFVLLSALPVTHNGKIDRSALPLPTSTNLLRDRVGAPESVSGTDIEQRVCDLVASLLGREIGVQENFFLIGGHSMLGVQLVSQIRQAFGVKLSLRQLFSGPTVAALSVEISSRTAVVPSVAGEPS